MGGGKRLTGWPLSKPSPPCFKGEPSWPFKKPGLLLALCSAGPMQRRARSRSFWKAGLEPRQSVLAQLRKQA